MNIRRPLTYSLTIMFAKLSEGKMAGNLRGLHNELHKVKNKSLVY